MLRSTVIVTAHKRKEFIKEAIKSLLENSLKPSEIIVVKNFKDDDVDSFLKAYSINNIYTDGETLGAKVSLGISQSSGDIIFFLEDDDLFSKDKIKEVTYKFSKYDIGFYHNSQEIFYDGDRIGNSSLGSGQDFLYYKEINSRELKDLLFKFKAGFNMSSIAISKDLAMKCVDLMRNVKITVDTFLLFCAVENNLPIMTDFRKLTYYRVLKRNSSNMKINISLFKMQYEDSLYFKQVFHSNILRNFIDMSIVQREMLYKILTKEINKKEALVNSIKILRGLLHYPYKWNFFLLILAILSIFSVGKSQNIYLKKVYSNSTFGT